MRKQRIGNYNYYNPLSKYLLGTLVTVENGARKVAQSLKGLMRDYSTEEMKNVLTLFRYSAPSIDKINAILGVKAQDQVLLKIFLRFFPALGVLISPVSVKCTLKVIQTMFTLTNKNGKVGLVKYLKVCSVCLQQCIGGHVLSDVGELGMRISRTNSGIPRIIPPFHRELIRQGDPTIIRLYLTLFALYRIVLIPATVKLGSITDPFKGTNELVIDHWIPNFDRVFVQPHFRRTSILMKMRSYAKIFVIWKSSAGTSNFDGPNPFATHPITVVSTGLGMLLRKDMRQALFAWFYNTGLADGSWAFDFFIPFKTEVISTNLRSIWMSIKKIISTSIDKDAVLTLKSLAPGEYNKFVVKPIKDWKPTFRLGKLALKHEPAGKMRVFAMVDPFTQWALYPLHKVILYLIRKYPMDGTFDQTKPLKHMVSSKQLYSLDLSSATDRLPINLQVKLISKMFRNEDLANKWKTLLVGRSYSVPKDANSHLKSVNYAVGQPMGALSSWAMLALTHHFIVQCAAWNCGIISPTRVYKNYALLGDDLVLGDHQVMISYLKILKALGVECGLHKSVVSHNGNSLEFAKRTFFKGIDVSPISLTEFSAACCSISEMISFSRKYNMSLAHIARALGYGWRVISSTNKPIGKLNAVLRGISIASIIPDSKERVLELFGSGKPIRSDLTNYIHAFVQFELSKIRDDLRSQITKDAKNDWSYLPILKEPQSFYQIACLEVINKLLLPLRNQAIVETGELVNEINKVLLTYYDDLSDVFLKYLEILERFTVINRSAPGLNMERTPTVRGRSPILLKTWNRWAPIFQGKNVDFNTFALSKKGVKVSKSWFKNFNSKSE